jgi:hypothetical protein
LKLALFNFSMVRLMHNLLHFNQLAGWKKTIKNVEKLESISAETERINDYYNCLIECDSNQSICKRICKEVLVD